MTFSRSSHSILISFRVLSPSYLPGSWTVFLALNMKCPSTPAISVLVWLWHLNIGCASKVVDGFLLRRLICELYWIEKLVCGRPSKNSIGFVYIIFCGWWGISMCVAWRSSIFSRGMHSLLSLSQITTLLKRVGEITKNITWEQALALRGQELHLLFWQAGCSLGPEGWLVGRAKNLPSPSSQEISTLELSDHQGSSGLCFHATLPTNPGQQRHGRLYSANHHSKCWLL